MNKLASNKHYKENKSNKPNNGMGKQNLKKHFSGVTECFLKGNFRIC